MGEGRNFVVSESYDTMCDRYRLAKLASRLRVLQCLA